jgi:uncharacterized BrkB/YihY/UPF0761 family membrane protein
VAKEGGLVQRATELANRLKDRGEAWWHQLQAGRSRSAAIDVALGSLEHDAEVGGGLLAGAVAFRVFLFIVPFVFFLVSAFGLAADATGKSAHDLAQDAGIAGLLATSINNMAAQSLWSRIVVCAVSGVATFVGARSLLKVITVVHVLVWRLPRVRVAMKRQALFTAGLIGLIAVVMVFVRLTAELREVSFPAWVVATAGATAVPAAIWLYVSVRVFPHPPEAGWRDLLPGALLVGVGIECVHVFTVVWISRSFEHKSETYGAVGGSLSLLLWAYVIGRVLAGSAVVNAVAWRRAHHLPPPAPVFPPPASADALPVLPGADGPPPPELPPPAAPDLPPPGPPGP